MTDFLIERVDETLVDRDFRPALESAVVNPLTQEVLHDEVDEVLTHIYDSIAGAGERRYVTALAGSDVLGVMGFRPVGGPEDPMRRYTTQDRAIEVVNALSLREERGRGVGYAMLKGIEAWGVELGFDQLVLNSGPRYMRTGWRFWRRAYGDPVAIANDFYGPRMHAPVWRHDLSSRSSN